MLIISHLLLIISPFSLPQINHFSLILVSGLLLGESRRSPVAMLDLWEDVAQNLACIIHSGTTNSPLFIHEDAETEEARTAWLVGRICNISK